MAHDKILDEPHEADQIGSSAMSFKVSKLHNHICP